MNWKQMTKQKKQKVMLFALGGVIGVYLLYSFALVPLLNGRAARAQERDDLRGKIQQAHAAINDADKLEGQLKTTRAEMENTFAKNVPPPDNALSWAKQFINSQTRALGLDVTSVGEVDTGSGGWTQPDQAKRIFKSYAIRVDMTCTFEQAKDLVRSLHEGNPYLAITGVTINSSPQNAEKHQVSLTLEWPSWRDPKQGKNPLGGDGGIKEKEPGKNA